MLNALAFKNWERSLAIVTIVTICSACSPVNFGMDQKDGSGVTDGTPTTGSNPPTKCYLGNDCDDGTPPPQPFPVKETLTTQTTTKVDVLVVIDNSGSMDTERANLANRLKSFLDPLKGLDWRLMVTTTDIDKEKGQPMKFGNGNKYLTSADADAETQFVNLLTGVAKGSGDEQPVKAQNLAFTNPSSIYRADAALVTVSISDEDERSTGGYNQFAGDSQFFELTPLNLPPSVLDTVHTTWNRQKQFIANAIVIPSGNKSCWDQQAAQNNNVYYGTRLEQLAALTGGVVGNICLSDYSSQLTSIGNVARSTVAALTLQCVPISMPTVDPLPSPYQNTQITQTGDKLYFNPELPSGVAVTVSYTCPGKK